MHDATLDELVLVQESEMALDREIGKIRKSRKEFSGFSLLEVKG